MDLSNNLLVGPIPEFKAGNVSYASNYFCQLDPGLECAPEVTALLDFLHEVNYPEMIVSEWSGNDPCYGPWMGLSCNPNSEVSIINLPGLKLNGTLSPSVVNLHSLIEIRLAGNHIKGPIPDNLTKLEDLRLLDLTRNNLEPPLPKFRDSVKVIIDGNPLLLANQTTQAAIPVASPFPSPVSTPPSPSPFLNPSIDSPTSYAPPSPTTISDGSTQGEVESQPKQSKRSKQVTTVAGISGNPQDGAWSIALSGGYPDDVDLGVAFTYTGCGGRDLKGTKQNPKNLRTAAQTSHQTFDWPLNAAIKRSAETKKPVRVIRGFKLPSPYAPAEGYRYDGLYVVEKAWMGKGLTKGLNVCRYAFRRMDGQPPLLERVQSQEIES